MAPLTIWRSILERLEYARQRLAAWQSLYNDCLALTPYIGDQGQLIRLADKCKFWWDEVNSLGNCTDANTPKSEEGSELQEKEATMSYSDCCTAPKMKMVAAPYAVASVSAAPSETDLSKTRRYLLDRVSEVRNEKKAELRIEFGMDPVYPKTRGELVEWLKAGKFSLAKDKEDRPFTPYEPLRSITLGDQEKDEAGYEAAKTKLDAARTQAEDIIRTLTEADGLKALQDFQAS